MTINWLQVLFHACWIFGLALLAAVGSFAHFDTRAQSRPFLAVLDRPGYGLALAVALLLIFAGLAGVDKRAWARGIWLLFGVVVLVGYWRFRRRVRQSD